MELHSGWYLAAHASEVEKGVRPLSFGSQRWLSVREGDRINVFDATCPHRGAHLGHGGRLDGDCLICPFHGRRVGLGESRRLYHVAEHPSLLLGDLLFVRFGTEPEAEHGFTQAITTYAGERDLIEVLRKEVEISGEVVIENAFDAEHFESLHHMKGTAQFRIAPSEDGELALSGTIGRAGEVGFFARAFSPTLVISELQFRQRTQVIITGTVPTATGCTVRMGYAVRPEDAQLAPYWALGTKAGFLQDLAVWNYLDEHMTPLLGSADEPLRAFGEFVARFPRPTEPRTSRCRG